MTRRVELDDDPELVREWLNLRTAAKRARDALEATEARLEARLGDAEEGTLAGQLVVRRRAKTRRVLDVERLRTDEPELYEQYHTTETRSYLKSVAWQRKTTRKKKDPQA